MKRSLYSALLLFLFSSCGLMKKSGFEKRRYRPGSYHGSVHDVHATKKKTDKKTGSFAANTAQASTLHEEETGALSTAKSVTAKTNKQIGGNTYNSLSLNKTTGNLKELISIDKIRNLKKQNTRQLQMRQKQASLGGDILAELLVTLVFTLVYYLIALLLMLLFPGMSQSLALGLSAIIILVAIIVLAIIFSRKKSAT